MATQAQTMNSTTISTQNAVTLRKAHRANGVFSMLSGILFILISTPIAEFLGTADTMILELVSGSTFILLTGVSLLVFAVGLFTNASGETVNGTLSMIAVELDIAWVIGSVIILLTGAWPLTTEGSWALLIVSDIVTVFAIWQIVGIRRMKTQ